MKLYLIAALGVFALAACGEASSVNPPTEPAEPPRTPDALGSGESGPGMSIPGVGPASFVGRWAADARWCPEGQSPDQAITITPLAFQGYENRCDLTRIDEVQGGYQVALRCQSEGQTTDERARFTSTGQTLDILWLDRPGQPVTKLLRCTTLADPPRVG